MFFSKQFRVHHYVYILFVFSIQTIIFYIYGFNIQIVQDSQHETDMYTVSGGNARIDLIFKDILMSVSTSYLTCISSEVVVNVKHKW